MGVELHRPESAPPNADVVPRVTGTSEDAKQGARRKRLGRLGNRRQQTAERNESFQDEVGKLTANAVGLCAAGAVEADFDGRQRARSDSDPRRVLVRDIPARKKKEEGGAIIGAQ